MKLNRSSSASLYLGVVVLCLLVAAAAIAKPPAVAVGGPPSGAAKRGAPAEASAAATPAASAQQGAAEVPLYYDYVENGELRGGMVMIDPDDPLDRAVLGLDEPVPAAMSSWAVSTIRNNGPVGNRVDIVMLGDGYTASELGDYATHVNNIMADFFLEPPLDAYSTYFNVHRVDVISNESGVDEPDYGIYKDTALDMTYNCGGIARLLCISVSKAEAAAALAPDKQTIIALANSTRYGGAGYDNLSTAAGNNSASSEVALHEYGHSFAKLADEYDYGGDETYTGPEPSQPDVSIYTASQMASMHTKWYRWLDLANVDTFEGAMYSVYGIYRPTYNSKMRSLGRPFEEVNVEQFVIQLYIAVDPIDRANGGSLDALPMYTEFYVHPQEPTDHALDVQWSLDGSPVAGATRRSYTPDYGALSPGTHYVSVTVVDNTSRVRDEGARSTWLTETRSWEIWVGDPIYVDDDAAGSPGQNGTLAHPYESIQLGINAASVGRVVKVMPGTYDEFPVMKRNIAVIGSGPEQTIVAPSTKGIVFLFDGVNCSTLANMKIVPHPESVGVRSFDSTVTLRDLVITGGTNAVGLNYTGSARIVNCAFVDNNWQGIWAGGQVGVDVVNCTIANNGTRGVYIGSSGLNTMTNSILWNNADDLDKSASSFLRVSHCDIGDGDYAGSNGNISSDPLFKGEALGVYWLDVASPCVDSGASDATVAADGRTFARYDEPSRSNTGSGPDPWYDMGAYEYSLDSDGDGLPDAVETDTGTYRDPLDAGTDPGVTDSDGDGLLDGEEVLTYGTDPTNDDTDGDGLSDGYEIDHGLDPLDPADGVAVLAVARSATNPQWVEVTWRGSGSSTFSVRWTADWPGPGRVWDVVDGAALSDIVYNGDETWTWTDKGADPDMGGQAPGDAPRRFYEVILE